MLKNKGLYTQITALLMGMVLFMAQVHTQAAPNTQEDMSAYSIWSEYLWEIQQKESGLPELNLWDVSRPDASGLAIFVTQERKEDQIIEEADAEAVIVNAAEGESIVEEIGAESTEENEFDAIETYGRTLTRAETITLSQKEYDSLCRIVHAEAGNEDLMGKILVANVVLNRYKSEKFPNTIEGVVTQTHVGARGLVYQFSPARPNGGYWKVVPSEETREAVDRALAGEDYSEGALYFAARRAANKNSMSWFDRKLTWLFKHGNHEFYVG